MIIKGIKTDKIRVEDGLDLQKFIDKYITELTDNSVVIFSSKVIGLIEGRAVAVDGTEKDELIKSESDLYLDRSYSAYNNMFTIKGGTLISASGIDESNADGHYSLWPKDTMNSAEMLRNILVSKFNLKNVGVIISDSTVMPLRRGSVGIMVGWSGFMALADLRGEPDLFGRPLHITTSAVGSSLSCAGNIVMGEGAEQTPIAVITDIPFVRFYDRSYITDDEYKMAFVDIKEDLFAPFLSAVKWQKGGSNENRRK
jgi:F420-0:gamma-glutamyl ligase